MKRNLSRTVLSDVVTVFITWLVVVLAKPRSKNKGKGKGKGGKAAPRDGGGYTSNLSGWHEETQRSVARLNNQLAQLLGSQPCHICLSSHVFVSGNGAS